ncbi:MAG TPA: hypothetical protein VFG86_15895, partial [Chloroflexota bacterium]|nr:hypothetical protein [Chloroflexota bacterium]
VLPSLEAVPYVVPQAEDGSDQDTVPLDRGTLQTLLCVDGGRTVREIIAARGSFEALWQLADLSAAGLVRLSTPAATPAAPAFPESEPLSFAARAEPQLQVVPPVASNGVAAAAAEQVVDASSSSCPKLGFEDDPGSSFARPTRLHRCFAAGAPLPLSLDQQRELCLSEQYSTCPRLAMAGLSSSAPQTAPAVVPVPSPAEVASAAAAPADSQNPRIVRLPIRGRIRPAAEAAPPAEPMTAAPPGASPTPLRARPFRAGIAAGAAATAAAPVRMPSASEPTIVSAPPAPPQGPPVAASATAAADASPPPRLPFGKLPLTTIAAIALVVLGLAAAALLLPNLINTEPDVDLSSLPNASAVASGTTVADLPVAKPTVAAPAANPTADTPAAAAQPGASRADPAANASTGAVSTLAAQVAPTAVPTAEPTVAPTPEGPRTVLDESFDENARNWPNNPQGPVSLTGGALRLIPRQAGQFIALAVPPVGEVLQDVTVSGTFRKVGGPAGGGYGFLVRDQGPGPRDGNNQAGRYYVLEVGDKGEVGIWRREMDHWVDLLPWQRTDAVRPGTASNEVTVSAIGDRLSLSVNGTEVGARTDSTLAVGNIGVFVGGDGNQVALENLTVKTP